MAHNRVDSFASSRVFLTESIVLTIESDMAQIKSIFITIESIFSIGSVYYNRVGLLQLS